MIKIETEPAGQVIPMADGGTRDPNLPPAIRSGGGRITTISPRTTALPDQAAPPGHPGQRMPNRGHGADPAMRKTPHRPDESGIPTDFEANHGTRKMSRTRARTGRPAIHTIASGGSEIGRRGVCNLSSTSSTGTRAMRTSSSMP